MFGGRGKRLIPVLVLTWLTWAHAQYELPDEIFARTLLIRAGNEMATAFKFDHGGRIYLVTTRHLGETLPLRNAVVQEWHGSWIDLQTDQFSRTLLIRAGNEMATAFKFDHGGRIYLVTTRHLGETLPLRNAVVQEWHGSWIDLQTDQVLLPASKDVDLAILKIDQRIGRPYKVVQSSEVLTTGQKVWYMGWFAPIPRPSLSTSMSKTSRTVFPEVPMVKIGTITAIDPSRPDSFEIHVDGAYNLRIASGPIVYWSPVHREFEVWALSRGTSVMLQAPRSKQTLLRKS